MGRIVSNFFISLDGVVEAPDQWHFDFWSDDMGAVMARSLETCSAFLMGRRLYDDWSAYFPGNDEDFGAFINPAQKYVVSSTLERADWEPTTVIGGPGASEDEVEAALRQVRASEDGDIGISGSPTLVRWLLGRGLVDRLALLVHPVSVGRGRRLLDDLPVRLDLEHAETLDKGVLHLAYAPRPA